MDKFRKLLILAFFAVFIFGLAQFTSAACPGEGGLINPITSCTFAALIAKIARIVAKIGMPLAAIAIIYAGFLFTTARGNEEQIKTARKAFFWTIIGTALLLGAWAIATAIENFIGEL